MTITRESLKEFATSEDGKQTLKNRCHPFPVEQHPGKALLETILDAVEFVKNPDSKALGLASTQVGDNHSWFVAKFGRPQEVVVVINPEIIGRQGNKQYLEGCFSEERPAMVKRSKDITVNYSILRLKPEEGLTFEIEDRKLERLAGQDAQVFQHESDHLKGVLIAQRGKVIEAK